MLCCSKLFHQNTNCFIFRFILFLFIHTIDVRKGNIRWLAKFKQTRNIWVKSKVTEENALTYLLSNYRKHFINIKFDTLQQKSWLNFVCYRLKKETMFYVCLNYHHKFQHYFIIAIFYTFAGVVAQSFRFNFPYKFRHFPLFLLIASGFKTADLRMETEKLLVLHWSPDWSSWIISSPVSASTKISSFCTICGIETDFFDLLFSRDNLTAMLTATTSNEQVCSRELSCYLIIEFRLFFVSFFFWLMSFLKIFRRSRYRISVFNAVVFRSPKLQRWNSGVDNFSQFFIGGEINGQP